MLCFLKQSLQLPVLPGLLFPRLLDPHQLADCRIELVMQIALVAPSQQVVVEKFRRLRGSHQGGRSQRLRTRLQFRLDGGCTRPGRQQTACQQALYCQRGESRHGPLGSWLQRKSEPATDLYHFQRLLIGCLCIKQQSAPAMATLKLQQLAGGRLPPLQEVIGVDPLLDCVGQGGFLPGIKQEELGLREHRGPEIEQPKTAAIHQQRGLARGLGQQKCRALAHAAAKLQRTAYLERIDDPRSLKEFVAAAGPGVGLGIETGLKQDGQRHVPAAVGAAGRYHQVPLCSELRLRRMRQLG